MLKEADAVRRRRKKANAKRAPLNMKATPELRAKLEAAAKRNDRPLTQQVETILESYFRKNTLPDLLESYFQIGRQMVAHIIEATGKNPHEDVETYYRVLAALHEWADAFPTPRNVKYEPLEKVEAAQTAFEEATAKCLRAKDEYLPKGYIPKFSPPPPQGLGDRLKSDKLSSILQEFLEAAKEGHDEDAVERFSAVLPLAEEVEAAEQKLLNAREALTAHLDEIKSKEQKSVRIRLAALGFNG